MRSSADTSVIELYHQAEDDFFVAISQLYRQFGSSLSAYCTGVEASSLNLLLVKQADPELASQLAQGIDFLQRTQMPFCVVVRDTLVAQVQVTRIVSYAGWISAFMGYSSSVPPLNTIVEYRT